MKFLHQSRVYANINADRPRDNLDIINYEIKWGQMHHELTRRLGKGKFGTVYLSQEEGNSRSLAVKVLQKRDTDYLVNREVMILEALQGSTNIIEFLGAVEKPQAAMRALVFEYVDPTGYANMAMNATSEDISFYMYELLKAIDACHSMGIMHRDIKPGNVLIDTNSRQLRLIDFGHADFYFPDKEYSVGVGSLHYNGPELLVKYRKYDYSLDLWSFGCMLAKLIFRTKTWFDGHDDVDQLKKFVEVLGSDELMAYVAMYNIILDDEIENSVEATDPIPLESFISENNRDTATPTALDLLRKLLRYDHRERLTAKEAMDHPFFQGVPNGYN
ncbi:hypothetical protein Aperf_G00000017336 [Anoplocephala perfoliata]